MLYILIPTVCRDEPLLAIHDASLIDLSLDMPLVLEFFDDADKVGTVLNDLRSMIEPGRIISWPIEINFE